MRELRPHQKLALDKLADGKILRGDVGTGKSYVAMAYYHENHAPKKLYVITTAKKRDSMDWDSEAIEFGVSRHEDVAYGGHMVVDSWNNLHKYVDVTDAFFILDEQRLVGTGKWTKSFYKIAKNNHWILLSATPGDTWLDYIPVFIANGFYKNRTEFIREHVVYASYVKFPKVQRYVQVNILVKLRNQILVDMPYERTTVRISKRITVDYDEELYRKVVKDRWHVYENRPLRDAAELFSVMRKVVNSDESRLAALSSILNSHPKVIVFYNFDYELEMLRGLASLEPTSKRSLADVSETGSGPGSDTKQLSPSSTQASTSSTPTPTASNERAESCQSEPTPRPVDTTFSTCLVPLTTRSSSVPVVTAPSASSSSLSDRGTSTILPGTAGSTLTDERVSRCTSSTTKSKSSSTDRTPSSPSECETSSTSSTNVGISIAEWNGHKHQPIPTADRWVYLVQYVAGAEGWNCTETDAMVFYSQTYSYKNYHQAHGRIDRLNTLFTRLFYYDLLSTASIDRAVRTCLDGKRSFNERAVPISF